MLKAATSVKEPSRLRPLAKGLCVAGLLLVAFGVLTSLVAGPLRSLDVALNFDRDLSGVRPVLVTMDRIGQRAVCLPVLALVAWLASRRAGTWRPMIVAGVSVFAVNVLVAVFKFGLERGAPLAGEPGFLEGGVMYPSGHTANVVLVYGLTAYLWWHYTDAPRRTRRLATAAVVALTMIMIFTSLTLRWHWFTDLIAGVLVGAAALRAATAIDTAVPVRPRVAKPTPPPVTREQVEAETQQTQLMRN